MAMIIKDNEYLGMALALVNSAKAKIWISTFKVERTEKPRGRKIETLFAALAERAKAGVKVCVLFNWHDDKKSIARTNQSAGQWLKSNGIEVKHLRNNRCCHAKILSVDDEKAIIGSHNWSVRSLESNFEISCVLEDKDALGKLNGVFARSWQDAKNF
jgi:cardiolipin synthase